MIALEMKLVSLGIAGADSVDERMVDGGGKKSSLGIPFSSKKYPGGQNNRNRPKNLVFSRKKENDYFIRLSSTLTRKRIDELAVQLAWDHGVFFLYFLLICPIRSKDLSLCVMLS